MSEDRGDLATEQVHPGDAALDELSAAEALARFTTEDECAVAAVAAARDELAAAVDLVADRLAQGGRLVYVGAGTSGRLGALDAAECPPTFQCRPDQVQAVIAGGPPALTRAVEGAEDSAPAGAAAIAELDLGPLDVAFGISAGGTTPFVHSALAEARRRSAATVFFACVPREQVPDEADVSIRAVTGPELVAGSTRLKAGTATKLALNALSTLVMARLGKVYGNLMVDVDTRANAKLVDRAERIVMQLTGIERHAARGLLERAGGRAKVAVVMQAGALEREVAEARLTASGGHLRATLDGLREPSQGNP